jgi:hypothetical protein
MASDKSNKNPPHNASNASSDESATAADAGQQPSISNDSESTKPIVEPQAAHKRSRRPDATDELSNKKTRKLKDRKASNAKKQVEESEDATPILPEIQSRLKHQDDNISAPKDSMGGDSAATLARTSTESE